MSCCGSCGGQSTDQANEEKKNLENEQEASPAIEKEKEEGKDKS